MQQPSCRNFQKRLEDRKKYPDKLMESLENDLAQAIFEQVTVRHKRPPESFGVTFDQDRRTHQCVLRIESDQPVIRHLVSDVNDQINLHACAQGVKRLTRHVEGKTVEYRGDSPLQVANALNQWFDAAHRLPPEQLQALEMSEVTRSGRN